VNVDEEARHELYRAAQHALGRTQANTLMTLLPPTGWADVATKDDLHQLEARLDTRMDGRFSDLDARLETRFSAIDVRFARVDARFSDLDARLETRFSAIDAHFAQVDVRFVRVDARFASLESLMGDLETRMDGRFAHLDVRFTELESRFEARLDRSIGELTRTLLLGLVGSLATMTSLCLGAIALTG
jgi:hypothetical protein